MSTGTCTVHTWNDGGDDDDSGISAGRRVNHELRDDPNLYARREADTSMRSRLRSHFSRRRNVDNGDDDGDDSAW